MAKGSASSLSWSVQRKRPPVDFFLFNGTSRKTQKKIRERDLGLFHRPALHSLAPPPTQIKSIFGSPFKVDSFSSIANGYSTFGNGGSSGAGRPVTSMASMGLRDSSSSATLPLAAGGHKAANDRDRKHFLVKLDHEGVTSPKTKNGKALLRLGGAGGRGHKNHVSVGAPLRYIQPSLLAKDGKRSTGQRDTGARSDALVKGVPPLRKDLLPKTIGVQGGDYDLDYPSDCPSSYSELDEDDEDDGEEAEARRRRATVAPHRGGRFLSRPSICFSSSSSSSSSSGSISSSSLCSSDNDSSYSSDEESSSVLLRRALLQQDKHKNRHSVNSNPQDPSTPSPSSSAHGYVVKSGLTVGGSKARAEDRKEYLSKGGMMTTPKAQLKRKESAPNNHHQRPNSPQTHSKDQTAKKQRMSSPEAFPNTPPLLSGRHLWRWSGNPTQV